MCVFLLKLYSLVSYIYYRPTETWDNFYDVFNLDQHVIDQYKAFSRSFTKIRSPEISRKVDALYDEKRFWPDPLLQINPHYANGGSIPDKINHV